MNLLAFYAYYDPESVASGYLQNDIVGALAECGKVSLHVPVPSRGIDQSVRDKYEKMRYEEQLNGRLVIFRYSLMKEGKNPIIRAARYLFQNSKQYFIAKNAVDADVIFSGSTPPTQGFFLALAKKRLVKKKGRNVPFIYNLQDIFPDSLAGTGLAKRGGLLWKIGRVLEDFTYRHADKIIVISEDFKKNIMAKGVPEDKIAVVYNWADQNAVVDVPREENKLFDKYCLDRTKFYIEYSGNIGLTQNMDMLLEVMKELKESHPQIGLVLVGEGAYKKQVEEIVKRDELTNVTMLPFQDYADISHVFSLGDAGLVISKPGVGANSVPSKTWSIMSASRPVLANFDENELKDILAGNECGIFTKAGDKEAFKQSVITLYENRELCKKYGKNGRQFVMDNLTKEVGTQKYVDVIKSVVNK